MSRYYQIEVELQSNVPMDEDQTCDALEILRDKFNMEVEDGNVHGGTFPGYKTLSGGASSEDGHEWLVELFPDFKVVSRWLCLDNQDWDDVFGEDDEDDPEEDGELDTLRGELEELEAEFTAQGGRGVELADRIDTLRAEIEKIENPEG